MNYNRNLFQQINRLTNEVTGSYRSYTPPEPPVPVTDTVTITTQPTDITCYIGDTATLSIVAVSDDETATLSYQWQLYDSEWLNIQGATLSSYTAPTLDEKEVYYRCVVTSDKGGTATSNQALLTVEAVPIDTVTITVQPQSASGNTGDVITLSVTATSDDVTATLSYQWQVKNGSTYNDISGATSNTYTVPTTTAGTQRYRVVVTSDKGGTATSNYADVTLVKPRLLKDNTDYKICWEYNGELRYAIARVIDHKISSTPIANDAAIFHVRYYGTNEYILETTAFNYLCQLAYDGNYLSLQTVDDWPWKDSTLINTITPDNDVNYLLYSYDGQYLTLDAELPENIPTFQEYIKPTDVITASIDTTRTTAPTYNDGYELPPASNSYYYAVTASSNLGKTISYLWSWQDTGGYTSAVGLTGNTFDRVYLTLTSTNAPNHALAGHLICTMTTTDSDSGYGTTQTVSIPCFR